MIKFQSILTFCKKPSFILTLILTVFFLKGVFIAALFPIFVGQDEARHYNSLQFLAEPKEKTWPKTNRIEISPSSGPSTLKYNYTQEIKETARAADDGQELYDIPPFNSSFEGENEVLINSRPWHQYNVDYPPNTAGKSLYHILAASIEKTFGNESILIRFHLARIFSVFLGTLTIFLFYFTIKNTGFSAKSTLILTALISFQPRFSIYTAAINYDALLILMFALFTLGGVLALKNGLDWKNLLMMLFAIVAGYYAKGTAVVLLGVFILLVIFLAYQKIKQRNKFIKYLFYLLCMLSIVAAFMFFRRYLPVNNNISGVIISLQKYFEESLTMGRFALTARTYWGTLTWVTSWFMDYVVNFIWIIESFATAGLALFFFSKKKPEYLPGKKYILFFLIMAVTLQVGIRAYDWTVFDKAGFLIIGTPGRYFLPSLAAHIVLIFTGLGMLLRKEKYFDGALALGLIAMLTFSLYLIFDVIIFRFYL